MFIAATFTIVKNWKATKMTINRWINTQVVLYPYNRINGVDICSNIDIAQNNNAM
jgi:hypothetical protein